MYPINKTPNRYNNIHSRKVNQINIYYKLTQLYRVKERGNLWTTLKFIKDTKPLIVNTQTTVSTPL